MPDFKVFISSTYRDLKRHRDAVILALRKLDGFSVVCMEDFGARDATPKELCLQKVGECEIYVGIFGQHYGFVPRGDNRSLTESEYIAAKSSGMPRLLFVSEGDFMVSADLFQSQRDRQRQDKLRKSVLAERGVAFFGSDAQELATKVVTALANWLIQHTIAAGATPASLHQLPSGIPDFTGRTKELNTLLAALERADDNASAISVIYGMGGIGKTSLAIQAARRLVMRYPDAQIVVELQGYGNAEPLKPIDAMAKVVQAFNPAFKPIDDLTQMTAFYRSVLNGKRALILFDNAPAQVDLRALVPPPPCGLIVTARDRIHLEGATPMALGLLARSESVELLRKTSRRVDVTDDEWERIASLCGDLPLALRVAGTFLGEAIIQSAMEYLTALADERTRLSALMLGDLPDHDVGAVLDLSARALVQRDAEAAARWQMLTVFPADFDEDAAVAVWSIAPLEARRTLKALLKSALLLFNMDDRRYRLHDLLRPIARQAFAFEEPSSSGPDQEARLRYAALMHASHFQNVLAKADQLFGMGGDAELAGLRLYDREAQNIATAAKWAIDNMTHDPAALTVAAHLPIAGVLILYLRLHPRQAITWLDAAAYAARTLGNRSLEGAHLGNLGLAYADLGMRDRAIKYYEEALVLCRESGDRRAEGNILGNIGNTFADLGDPRRAIEYHKQAVVAARETGDRRAEGNSLGNIGNACADLGDTPQAFAHYEQALSVQREIGDRRGEGRQLGNIGVLFLDMNDTDRAIEHFEKALEIHRDIGDRNGESTGLANLGRAYASLGVTRRAIDYCEAALAILEEIESPDAAKVRKWLGEWRAESDQAP